MYSIWFDKETMRDDGDTMIYSINMEEGTNVSLICNAIEEKMKMILPSTKLDCKNEYSIIENDIIDLNANGERWEGDSFNCLPFGYGRVYDANNMLRYCGWMLEGKKICYGEEFYEDGETIEYKGNFMNNMRHGYGILYDKEKSILHKGHWHFGMIAPQLILPSKCDNIRLFTDSVQILIVEDGCFCDVTRLHFEKNPVLKRVVIGNGSFKMVHEFSIEECYELVSVLIGEDCFVNEEEKGTGNFTIRDCEQFEMIEIGARSFHNYRGKFELKSDFLPFLLIRFTLS